MSRNSRTPSCALRTLSDSVSTDHAVAALDHAARLQRRAATGVDLDEAHAAHADRVHPRVVAEPGDVGAGALARVDEQLALLGDDLVAVDGDGDRACRSSMGLGASDITGSAVADSGMQVALRDLRLELVAEPAEGRGDRRDRRRAERADRGLAGRERHGVEPLARDRRRPGTAPARCCRRCRAAGRGRSGGRGRRGCAGGSSPPSSCPRDTASTCRTTRGRRTERSAGTPSPRRCVSSITTMAPEPSIEPAAPTARPSSGRSTCSGKNHGADAPPGMNILSSWPSRIAAAVALVLEQLAVGGRALRDLEHAGRLHVARHGDQPGAGRRLRPERPCRRRRR